LQWECGFSENLDTDQEKKNFLDQEKYAEAEEMLREVLAVQKRVEGAHRWVTSKQADSRGQCA
jgi:hypothetical protein